MANNEKVTHVGITFLDALCLIFVALKLTGFISWSWLWVLAPIWIPIALMVLVLAVYLLVLLVGWVVRQARRIAREARGE